MSRIGKLPIAVPQGVKVSLQGSVLSVEGPKGKMKREISPLIRLDIQAKEVKVIRTAEDDRLANIMHGTTRTLIQNMMVGVSQGFTRDLDIQGVGYRAQTTGNKVSFSLGFSHPVEYVLPEGVAVKIADQTKLLISGCDKEVIGQVAAEIRALRPPEPYKGKGIRYRDEVVQKKAGKAAVGSGGGGAAKG